MPHSSASCSTNEGNGTQAEDGSKKGSTSRQSSIGSAKRSGSTKQSQSFAFDGEFGCASKTQVLDEIFLKVDKTLALIKPEAMKYEDEIEEIIREKEFEVLAKRTIQLTPEQAAGFYKEHFGQPYFANLVIHMSDNPVTIYCLAKEKAVEEWLEIIGPTNVLEAKANHPESIRAKYGSLEDDGEYYNAIHGSKDFANSLREIHFFFPKLIEEPILRGKQVHDYLQTRVNSTLLKGLEELCKEKPEEPLIWLADWLLTHNPYSPLKIPSTESEDRTEGTTDYHRHTHGSARDLISYSKSGDGTRNVSSKGELLHSGGGSSVSVAEKKELKAKSFETGTPRVSQASARKSENY